MSHTASVTISGTADTLQSPTDELPVSLVWDANGTCKKRLSLTGVLGQTVLRKRTATQQPAPIAYHVLLQRFATIVDGRAIAQQLVDLGSYGCATVAHFDAEPVLVKVYRSS